MAAKIINFESASEGFRLQRYFLTNYKHEELCAFLDREYEQGCPMKQNDPVRFRALCQAACQRTKSEEFKKMVRGLYE
jgi:hypothetical protein